MEPFPNICVYYTYLYIKVKFNKKRREMKRLFLVTIFVIACITSCKVDVDPINNPIDPCISGKFLDGVISINDCPGMDIQKMSVFPEGTYTESSKRSLLKSGTVDNGGLSLPSHQYRFKLVAQMSKLDVQRNGQTYGTQATHVKITDIVNNVGYAFVTYNNRNEPNIGGIVLYRFTVVPGTLEEADVQVQVIQSMELETAQLNAIDYDPNDPTKLYVCGATDRPSSLGLSNRLGRAFFMILEIDPVTKKFSTEVEPVIRQLSSFQATSIRKFNDKVYITVGDGKASERDNDNDTPDSDGGLYIFDTNGNKVGNAILGLKHARSVDVDETGIYLFQSNHARITKYDLNGSSPQVIYNAPNHAMQRNAKSEIMVWKDYLFVAENETGLKMLFKDGSVNEGIFPPNSDSPDWNEENDVTNSVSMNSDEKIIFIKDKNGNEKSEVIQSDLLLVANGGQGLSWYDITKSTDPDDNKDYIVESPYNNILKGSGSANFVTSKGNVVFVADGLGGLKVLYIGQNFGDIPPPIGIGCDLFMGYLYYGADGFTPLFPETQSVFRNGAHNIVKQLFQLDKDGIANRKAARDLTLDYIEIINDTELYITFLLDGAGYYNSLGFFVLPAKTDATTNQSDWEYFNNNIKPNMVNNTTNNYLKPEYTIFKCIAGAEAKQKSKGTMVGGSLYSVGDGRVFKKGERIVFFMLPDGFNSQSNQAIVDFRSNNYKCIFFMNKFFNEQLGLKYNSAYGDFAGQQFNTVYSADCKSMIMVIEDMHIGASDVDFNDIIFTLSDNMINKEVQNFKAPYWAIEGVNAGEQRIFPAKEIFGVVTAFD